MSRLLCVLLSSLFSVMPAWMRRAMDMPGARLAAFAVFALVACLVATSPASAVPPQQVQQTSISAGFVNLPGPPPKRVWRETVTFRNDTGRALPGAIVTSQPYSGAKDFPGIVRGGKTAAIQEQKVDFAVGEEKKVVFDHPAPADGKGYTAWYTDVYDTPANRAKGIGPWVGVGNYAFLLIPLDTGGSTVTDSFLFPYPDAIERRGLGPVTYSLVVTELELPADWSFAGLSEESFLLAPFTERFVGAGFNVPTGLVAGQVAFVEFDVRIGDETLGSTYLGIQVVPEPRAATLVALGLGALAMVAARRQRTAQTAYRRVPRA